MFVFIDPFVMLIVNEWTFVPHLVLQFIVFEFRKTFLKIKLRFKSPNEQLISSKVKRSLICKTQLSDKMTKTHNATLISPLHHVNKSKCLLICRKSRCFLLNKTDLHPIWVGLVGLWWCSYEGFCLKICVLILTRRIILPTFTNCPLCLDFLFN